MAIFGCSWPHVEYNVFFLHGYTAYGIRRVRFYFSSRSATGTIFGSEKLFGIFSQKKIFWTISAIFPACTPKKRVFQPS